MSLWMGVEEGDWAPWCWPLSPVFLAGIHLPWAGCSNMEGGPSPETHRDLGSSQFSEESKPAYCGHLDTVWPPS